MDAEIKVEMQEGVLTKENLVEFMVTRKTKESTFRLYENKAQKGFFWIAIWSFVLLVVAAVVNKLLHFDPFCIPMSLIGMSLGLISSLAALTYQILSIVPAVRDLKNVSKNVEKGAMADVSASFEVDIKLIEVVARCYETIVIELGREYFKLSAVQMRERVGLIMGKLDAIGVIPTMAAAWITWQKFLVERAGGKLPQMLPEWLAGSDWLFLGVGLLYMAFIRLMFTAQWMEQIELLLSRAVLLKQGNKPKA